MRLSRLPGRNRPPAGANTADTPALQAATAERRATGIGSASPLRVDTSRNERLDRFGEPIPLLGAEHGDNPTSPRSLAERIAEEGMRAEADNHPTSPRAPLRSVHAPGGSLAREAATTLPEVRVAGRMALTGAGLTAGGLNGGAIVGLFSALPPVEPISISLSAVASASDAAAAYGAHRRGGKLREIQANAPNYHCDHAGPEHAHLANDVLPYVIAQQDKRKMRKGRAAIPFIGAIGEGIRGVYMHFRKKRAGTLGVDRRAASEDLARHLVPHHCELAEDMTEALFGRRRMEAIRGMDPDAAADAIHSRLKSN